jgi:hypothetical protein
MVDNSRYKAQLAALAAANDKRRADALAVAKARQEYQRPTHDQTHLRIKLSQRKAVCITPAGIRDLGLEDHDVLDARPIVAKYISGHANPVVAMIENADAINAEYGEIAKGCVLTSTQLNESELTTLGEILSR